MTKKDLKALFGDKDCLQKQKKEFSKEINILKSGSNIDGLFLNSRILALKRNGNVTHIVNTRKESNLVLVAQVKSNMAVPRYTNEHAQKWLKEELILKNCEEDFKYEKTILSESELRSILIDNLEKALKNTNDFLEAYEKAEE